MEAYGPEPKPVSKRVFFDTIDTKVCLRVRYVDGTKEEFYFPFQTATSILLDFRNYLANKHNSKSRYKNSAIVIKLIDPGELVFALDAESVSTMWINEALEYD